MAYDVHLETFEGPLDLLLYLIRKDDLDIYDIPISQITSEYLEYLDLMKEFNLDIASQFLVMSATLMQIKSRMLLPSPEHGENEEDPRADLVSRLIEYEKYKQVGYYLSVKELNEQGVFYKSKPVFDEQDFVLDASLFDLIESFRQVLKELPEEVKEIVYEEIPIEQKIRELIDLLEGRRYINFKELLKREKTRTGIIVLFMALLELIRLKQVVARQARLFGQIRIYRVMN
jgi:segregation and condensation protein A